MILEQVFWEANNVIVFPYKLFWNLIMIWS